MSKQIDVMQTVMNLEAKPLTIDNNGKEQDMLLKNALVNALLDPRNENENTSGETKLQRFNLAQEIYAAEGSVSIGNSDIGMLKKLVNVSYSAIIVGQVYKMLDAKPEDPPKVEG